MIACKLMLIGDSLIVGLGGYVKHDINLGKVGDSISGTISRYERAGKPSCDNTVISLGSNVLFNNLNKEKQKYKRLISSIDSKNIVLLPVPAKGKYLWRANNFNTMLGSLANEYSNVTFIPLKSSVRNSLARDKVHLTRRANRIWKKQVEDQID